MSKALKILEEWYLVLNKKLNFQMVMISPYALISFMSKYMHQNSQIVLIVSILLHMRWLVAL